MLELKNISFQVPDEKTRNTKEIGILKDVSLTLEDNQFVVITGPNGGGKSTLAKIIAGIEKPTSGQILFDGQDITGMKDEELTIFRRRKIGFIFQNYNLVSVLNTEKNITLPIRLDGNKVDENYITSIVSSLGIAEKRKAFPNQLSGGQQQRVAIARALASKPALILADEPTGNLDSRTSAEVMGLLKMTSTQFHQTIVMITHNEAVAQLADRIIHIEDGKIVGGSRLEGSF